MRENRFIVLVFSVVPPLASLAPERQLTSKLAFAYSLVKRGLKKTSQNRGQEQDTVNLNCI